MSKYHSRKIQTVDGTFDSKREYDRWCELKLLQRVGKISDLRRQVKYELVPTQRAPGKKGKVLEYPVNYIADFVYTENGETVVEDSKGFRTDEYKIKRKLMLWKYGIRIKET